ncbi:outer membrane protein assembly factor BamE [Roseomonas sp. 18066]|uniref:outer membrane protein assembly factor BamE n=1 Tax=Roseomonas sp. 18066 TaxID=2681412 RepID=UPI001F27B0F0|nr:outer membrane protein assembly factor BamE [Roseomonas sp. 18066]
MTSDTPSSDMSRRQPRLRARAALLALALALPAAGCSIFEAPPVQRGNKADPDLLAQLSPGVQTQADVQALLGPPSATGTFDRNHWYYISATTRLRPASHGAVENQRVVVMTFDDGGTLRQVKELGEGDMRSDVGMVDRTTPVPGTDRTVMQALFGNIGRVGAGGLTSQDSGPGGGPGR